MKKIFWIIILTVVVVILFFVLDNEATRTSDPVLVSVKSDVDFVDVEQDNEQTKNQKETSESLLIEPTMEFQSRITKKLFGIYITPENSPVSPEKFSGYHTGVDVEFADVEDDVDVYAVYDGRVIYSGFVNGYGGLVAVRHDFDQEQAVSLYGHLDPDRLLPLGTNVDQGQVLGFLGKAYSGQTDGERKHLHFAIIKGKNLNFKGYVTSKSDLSLWYDPLLFFKKYNENKLK